MFCVTVMWQPREIINGFYIFKFYRDDVSMLTEMTDFSEYVFSVSGKQNSN